MPNANVSKPRPTTTATLDNCLTRKTHWLRASLVARGEELEAGHHVVLSRPGRAYQLYAYLRVANR